MRKTSRWLGCALGILTLCVLPREGRAEASSELLDGYAAYDSTLKAPACHTLASRCITHSLLDGRAGLGPEKNTPNTIYDSCMDGTQGTYRYTESVEEIRMTRT